MQKILLDEIALCFRLGADVVRGNITLSDAALLAASNGMNPGSARGYIKIVRDMTEGVTYKRTLNEMAADYYLSNIGEEFGASYYKNALSSLRKHIDYYESNGKRNVVAQKRILAKHSARLTYQLNGLPEADVERETLQGKIAKSASDTSEARRARLESATGIAEPFFVVATAYRRNHDVIAERLSLAGDICGLCYDKAPFDRENGTPFLEVHHIIPLSEGGKDTVENTAALCPNCHREVHFGNMRQVLREKLLRCQGNANE